MNTLRFFFHPNLTEDLDKRKIFISRKHEKFLLCVNNSGDFLLKCYLWMVNYFPLCQVITSGAINQAYQKKKILSEFYQTCAQFKAILWIAQACLSPQRITLAFWTSLCGFQKVWSTKRQRVTSVKENSKPRFSAYALQKLKGCWSTRRNRHEHKHAFSFKNSLLLKK